MPGSQPLPTGGRPSSSASWSASCLPDPVSSARSWTCSAPPSNRDFAIYKAYDDVEGSADLANPKTNQPGHDGVNVTPVINDKSDMEAANI